MLRRWVLASDRPSAEALADELGLKRGALYTRATRLRQTVIEEVERRLRWLQVHPEALASERDAILRAFREPA